MVDAVARETANEGGKEVRMSKSNSAMQSHFNLVDEPWVSCVYVDGRAKDVSLRTVFRDAPFIRTLSGDLPQQETALLRFLLGIMYRAFLDEGMSRGDMRLMWKSMWESGRFAEGYLDEYLDAFHDRFHLIGGDRPFYQTPGLAYAGDKTMDSIGEIIADVPKPDKFLFAMRSMPSLNDGIDLAQAARWLIFAQSYDVAGIKSPVVGNTHVNKGKVYAPKGLPGTGWQGTIGTIALEGDTLFETLMLNWCLYIPGGADLFGLADDVPPWEHDVAPTADLHVISTFTGPVGALTMQSRRILLVPNERQERIVGVINCYGDVIAAYDTDSCETMTAWYASIPQQKKLGLGAPPLMPTTHKAGRALWRGLTPILSADPNGRDMRPTVVRWVEELQEQHCIDGDRHTLSLIKVHAQGMTYGTQSSVYESGIDDAVDLNTAFIRRDFPAIATVVDVVSATDEAVEKALSVFITNLRVAAGDKTGGDRMKTVKERVKEEAYARLDAVFRDHLAAFGPECDCESYRNEWQDDVHRILLDIGRDYLSDADVRAFGEHANGGIGSDWMSAARAQRIFRAQLNRILGRLSQPTDSPATDDTATEPAYEGAQ